jgi:uncharacterized OB-fold protein
MRDPGALTAPFWAAAARHELVVQRCASCGALRHYPRPMCPDCHGTDHAWQPLSGRGTVYTFTVSHQAFHPAWRDRVPVAIATIELEEGVRMVSDLPAEDVDRVRIGMPVEVFFDDVVTESGRAVTLPRFRSTDES